MSKFKYQLVLVTLLSLVSSHTFAENLELPAPDYTCSQHPDVQALRSQELQYLMKADQKDRENWGNLSEDQRIAVAKNDLARRKRVGEIFGEGCFRSSNDYSAASLIYQHGTMPDHFYSAFTWSNRAVELGDKHQQGLVAMTIDRYLVSSDKKQLFGTQYYTDGNLHGCYCIQPTEDSYPDDKRKQFSGATLKDHIDYLQILNAGKNCPITTCSTNLKPTPQGSIPGFW